MQELTPAGRLAAWGGTALAGRLSPDAAAEAVAGGQDAGHRVFGVDGEADGVSLTYALARLRTLGGTGLRLVLPLAGDATGLPGPPAFNEKAVSRGGAVLVVGLSLAALPEGRGTWSVHPVARVTVGGPSCDEAHRELRDALRECTELLSRLSVARWEPAAAELLAHRAAQQAALPPSHPASAHLLLEVASRVASIVAVARDGADGSTTAAEMSTRAAALRRLDIAARRGIEAACSAT
ncbi:MAG: hypothetical protein QOJ60_3171 [Actinomycetota bacterium]|nr:hypothetical protein [Actinomycetota bacterium]